MGMMAKARHHPFYLRERKSMRIVQEAGYDPGNVWTIAKKFHTHWD
jgi:hypothetical protein